MCEEGESVGREVEAWPEERVTAVLPAGPLPARATFSGLPQPAREKTPMTGPAQRTHAAPGGGTECVRMGMAWSL